MEKGITLPASCIDAKDTGNGLHFASAIAVTLPWGHLYSESSLDYLQSILPFA